MQIKMAIYGFLDFEMKVNTKIAKTETKLASVPFSSISHRFLANVNSRSRSLYAISRPSVVCLLSVCRLSLCLSVTLVHPTQAVELFGNYFHNTIAQGLYFSGAKNRLWGTPLSP